jgi:hypothetical protein
MDSDPVTSPPVDDPPSTRDANTPMNALIGGVVGVLLSFVPLSPVLGGAVAGYLEGGTAKAGLRVGSIAGLVMLLPFSLFGLFGLWLFVLDVTVALLGFVIVLGFLGFYTIGLSALGGVLGVYLHDEI